MVEEYIRGREFTVGMIGNGNDIEILPIMEIKFTGNKTENLYSYRVKKESETCSYYFNSKIKADFPSISISVFRSTIFPDNTSFPDFKF